MASGKRYAGAALAAALLLSALQPAWSANPYAGRDLWQPPQQGQWTFPPSRQPQAATPVQNQTYYPPQPAYGGWPGYAQQPYYQTQAAAPYVESELSLQRPYVQQSVILKLSVISQNNLLTANPQIPQSDAFMAQLMEGPTTYTRTRGGKREIVNDFFYELTPMRAGNLELPAIHITGEEAQSGGYGGGQRTFDVATSQPLTLHIREANPASTPWLPLEQLTLKVGLPSAHKAAAGKPMHMTVELDAQGAGGNQLPSLEAQLKSDAFRVYREQSEVTTRLDRNRNRIVGSRLESFTLVPQYGGDLKLPELRVNWWNTRSDMAQRTSFPLQPIAVSGASKPSGLFASDEQSSLFMSGSSAAFWIPLSVVFGIIFGYWLAIWIAHRRKGGHTSPLQPLVSFLQRPMHQMAPAFSPLKERLRTTGRILNPVTRWQRWRRHLVGMLPLSVRFHYCVRFVDEERDPEVWGYTLRFLANKHLGLPINAPYSVIGKHILEFHPKADPHKIRALIHELEESVYGHHGLDFERWKEAFKHEIRPSLRLWPRRSGRKHALPKALLPGLNPGVR